MFKNNKIKITILGTIVASKLISTTSPYLFKYGIDMKDKSWKVAGCLSLFFLARYSTSYLNELRNVIVSQSSISIVKNTSVKIIQTIPETSIPVLCKQVERKKKAIKSLFTIKYTHITPLAIELGLSSFFVYQNLGPLFCGILFSTVSIYIIRSIQITNQRVKERTILNRLENNWIESLYKYFQTHQNLSFINKLENILQEEHKLVNSLKDLNTQQQIILCTGNILMTYLWFINPELTISDFVMMNIIYQQMFQPLNQAGMIYREWKQSKQDLKE